MVSVHCLPAGKGYPAPSGPTSRTQTLGTRTPSSESIRIGARRARRPLSKTPAKGQHRWGTPRSPTYWPQMARLAATLRKQQAEATRLDAAIATNLKELGYGE